jgi:hypothetical protein
MSWCGIVSDPGVSFFTTSDRLHYAPLIHANVSSGASCRACVEESYRDLDVRCLPVYVSPGVPPWVHVFSVFWLNNSYRFQSQLTYSLGNERMSNCTTFFLYFFIVVITHCIVLVVMIFTHPLIGDLDNEVIDSS